MSDTIRVLVVGQYACLWWDVGTWEHRTLGHIIHWMDLR